VDKELKEIAEGLCGSEAWEIWVAVSGKDTACTAFAGDTESLDEDAQKFCTNCNHHQLDHGSK
jgi:hypothetical protein